MTRDQMIEELRRCLPDPLAPVGSDEDLLTTGALDSLTFVDLIAAIDARLHLKLPDDVVFGPRFNTLAAMAASILALKEQGS